MQKSNSTTEMANPSTETPNPSLEMVNSVKNTPLFFNSL
jgi:hypothetical protein